MKRDYFKFTVGVQTQTLTLLQSSSSLVVRHNKSIYCICIQSVDVPKHFTNCPIRQPLVRLHSRFLVLVVLFSCRHPSAPSLKFKGPSLSFKSPAFRTQDIYWIDVEARGTRRFPAPVASSPRTLSLIFDREALSASARLSCRPFFSFSFNFI